MKTVASNKSSRPWADTGRTPAVSSAAQPSGPIKGLVPTAVRRAQSGASRYTGPIRHDCLKPEPFAKKVTSQLSAAYRSQLCKRTLSALLTDPYLLSRAAQRSPPSDLLVHIAADARGMRRTAI